MGFYQAMTAKYLQWINVFGHYENICMGSLFV